MFMALAYIVPSSNKEPGKVTRVEEIEDSAIRKAIRGATVPDLSETQNVDITGIRDDEGNIPPARKGEGQEEEAPL
jgi:hypothetical protein